MKILVTGSKGFLAKNLIVRIKELKTHEILEFHRGQTNEDLEKAVSQADFIFHLAGVNRPKNVSEFHEGNTDLTRNLAGILTKQNKKIPLVLSSSIQAELDNPYGKSKKEAEESLNSLNPTNPVFIFRLPNVFGKWSLPNYNSAVATFCHNIARDLPITINDPAALVQLVYVDDVVSTFLMILENTASLSAGVHFKSVDPVYKVSVGDLANKIKSFKESRQTLITEHVGMGFDRALHATYLSFLTKEDFAYSVPRYADTRGVFVEMLKTKESGQFSFFTAGPGITRGGHYHHTKTEKFLILKGKALYRFRHIVTREFYELEVDAAESRIVETIPGWSHDIKNIGSEELVVMLWANEIFDRAKPDTIGHEV